MIRGKRLPRDIRDRLRLLAQEFERDSSVIALYLFGSFARGEEGPLSDIDVAVLADRSMLSQRVGDPVVEYLGRINRVLGTDEVSFVLLNEAPLVLRYEVIRGGQVLVDNRPRARLDFEVHTEDLYMDFRPHLEAYDEELLRQLTAATP